MAQRVIDLFETDKVHEDEGQRVAVTFGKQQAMIELLLGQDTVWQLREFVMEGPVPFQGGKMFAEPDGGQAQPHHHDDKNGAAKEDGGNNHLKSGGLGFQRHIKKEDITNDKEDDQDAKKFPRGVKLMSSTTDLSGWIKRKSEQGNACKNHGYGYNFQGGVFLFLAIKNEQ